MSEWLRKKMFRRTVCVLTAICLTCMIALKNPIFFAKENESATVVILMYHSLLKDPARHGKYVVSPDLFESDLKYLKEHGYSFVGIQELIDFVYSGAPLPKKSVVITFDDGYYNNYLYAYPLLEKYDAKMVISVIGKYTDLYDGEKPNAYYSHVTWDMINEMLASGRVEIGNHTYSMHTNGERRGSKKIKGETDEHYSKILTEDIGKLQAEMFEHTGTYPSVYTYPFGAISNASFGIIADMGFLASLSCAEKPSTVTRGKPESLRCLGRFLRPTKISSADFFEKKINIEELFE
ncbi:MAG: polysaccharide deacetylase family protein [Eubacteriales bacterium]|nr:polysaccharide deacetylase family protein [Clostridiales bacterium]MDD6342380.1 polysaccharide deacetylase family protein [Eubacteriales bacterium]MDD7393248.1 polysaccharide deacetylase family protein [Eubacteriales bacterium]MDY3760965.1 polysaccharide deacetylase family protein [Eubacteriales bacterium]